MENRNELKFIFKNQNINNFYSWLYKFSNSNKKYPDRTVNSVYLDDVNFKSARDNLIGVSQREKIRFRWYDEIELSKNFFLEIKKKNNKLSSKEVFSIPVDKFNLNEIKVKDLINISNNSLDIKQKIKLKRLFPTLLCSYDREYFENIEGLRITIDKNISFSEVSNNIKLKNYFNYKSQKIIVEFKFSEKISDHVYKILNNTFYRPTRNSKYLLGLQKLNRLSYI